MKNTRRVLLATAATLLALNIPPREAKACDCDLKPSVAWPNETALTDSSVIILGATPLADANVVLSEPNGARVPLKPSVTVPFNGPCTELAQVFVPSQLLAPNTAYTLTVNYPAGKLFEAGRETKMFTTTSGPAVPVTGGAKLWLFSRENPPQRQLTLFASHDRGHPMIVSATGQGASSSAIVRPKGPEASPVGLPLGSTAKTTVTVHDHTGQLIETREMASPTRCLTTTEPIDGDHHGCASNPGNDSWGTWADVAPTCAPGIVEPDAVAGTGGTSAKAAIGEDNDVESGCSVSRVTHRNNAGGAGLVLLALGLFVRRARRRR